MHPIIEIADSEKQFLLVGHTNHESIAVHRQTHSVAFLKAAAEKGYKHVFLEASETMQPLVDRLIAKFRADLGDKYTPDIVDQLTDNISHQMGMNEVDALKFKLLMVSDVLKIKPVCIDPRTERQKTEAYEALFQDISRILAGETTTSHDDDGLMSQDEKLVDSILNAAGTNKVIVIYGAAHFSAGTPIDQKISPEQRTIINVYDNPKNVTEKLRENSTPDTLHFDAQSQSLMRFANNIWQPAKAESIL